MKKSFFLLVFCFGFLLMSTSSVTALSSVAWEKSVVSAANAMLEAQNNDGSFDWVNDGNKNTPGSVNTQGATARGLIAAYNVTCDSRYLDAANRVGEWINLNVSGIYNKDIEFLYELKAAGGTDFTEIAKNKAISYINDKITQKGGTGAEAVRSGYLDSDWTAAAGTMNGTKLWMIGEWGHVAQFLGDSIIYDGYSGNDMAVEMGSLLATDYLSFDYINDNYGTLGLVGILEATSSGSQGGYGNPELDAINALLAMDTTGWQDTGYKTYALSLYGHNDSSQLADWIEAGYFYTGTDAYLESMGEALLGIASAPAPVPEPASFLLMSIGIAGLSGLRRKKA